MYEEEEGETVEKTVEKAEKVVGEGVLEDVKC